LTRICARCRHFERAPERLEAELPGLASLSSAHAAVRADDGLCAVHDRYVASYASCDAFQPLAG
jgi:hypothetical protein